MRDIKLKYVIGAIAAVGMVVLTLYLASINTGTMREVSLLTCGALISIIISAIVATIIKNIRPVAIKRLLVPLSIFIISVVALVFIILYYRNINKVSIPDKIAYDVIADFKGSKGTGALTAFGLPFSIMSDSSQNMESKIWYERIHGDPKTGGFLRIHYQFLPYRDREGYVGIYADFTLPPANPVSLLEYDGISFRMRINQEIGNYPEIRVVLYSDNIKNMEYAYPIARVQPAKQWGYYNIPFSKFESPPHAFKHVELDPGRVFRFAFVLVSDSEIHGQVDIDELKLF